MIVDWMLHPEEMTQFACVKAQFHGNALVSEGYEFHQMSVVSELKQHLIFEFIALGYT